MTSLPSLALVAIFFIASAAVIWIAGIELSQTTDVLSQRWHLGSALGGVILLAIATNLPEIAITASAALSHHVDVAVGNILGGIAIQTVVLAVLDAAGTRPRKPLTYLAASLTLVLEAGLVVALLVIVVMSTQLPSSLIAWRLTPPGAVLIVVVWAIGLFLIRRAGHGLRGTNPGTRRTAKRSHPGTPRRPTRRPRRQRASPPAAPSPFFSPSQPSRHW